MARKLKTYQTSMGFFDLAMAAPSMKAALEAWGARTNLFHQGFAKEADDPQVIAATMAKPGVILKRPVGSSGPFKEDADLPTNLPRDGAKGRSKAPRAKPEKRQAGKTDERASRKAAAAIERDRKRRESERRKADVARAREREQRQKQIAEARSALEEATREHDRRIRSIEAERAAVERRAQAEDARWEKQKNMLEIALRRARQDD